MAQPKTGRDISCKQCGRVFYVPACRLNLKYPKLYCSRACSAINRTGSQNPKWKGGEVERQCEICNKTFSVRQKVVKAGNGRFCSLHCNGVANGKRKKAVEIPRRIEKICVHCGNSKFVKPSHEHTDGRYCSPTCRSEHAKIKMTGEKNPNYRHGLCVGDGHYSAFGQIRKNAKKIKTHSIKDWQELKAAYAYTCPCCKQVEPIIKLEKDHIIPISKGGHDGIDNIQPLCRICNSNKFTKTVRYAM